MKPKTGVLPLTSPKGGTVLDWPIESGIAEKFLQQVEGRRKQHRRRRRAVASASVLAVAGLFALLWGVPYLRDTAVVGTSAAHRETVALADGSSAELNAATSLHTDFRYGRRTVRLERGEAFFSVAKDPAHPFLVETSAGTVRVTGTKFNVRLADDGAAEVTLFEGSVSFAGAGPEALLAELKPGQQVDTAKPEVHTLSVANLENVAAWRQGRLAFDGLTLGEAAARLAAYHGIRIDVSVDATGLRPGGSFPVDDLPAVFRALETALTVRVLAGPDGSYRIVLR